jgi:hypothetical protein
MFTGSYRGTLPSLQGKPVNVLWKLLQGIMKMIQVSASDWQEISVIGLKKILQCTIFAPFIILS